MRAAVVFAGIPASLATLESVSANKLIFTLGDLRTSTDVSGEVSVTLSGSSPRNVLGEPELPLVRKAMLVPPGSRHISVKLTNAKIETFPLSEWGARVAASKGLQPLRPVLNATLPEPSLSAYSHEYPVNGIAASASLHTWRDVQGAVVELNPIAVDHSRGQVQVLHSGDLDLDVDGAWDQESAPKIVDREFLSAYSFVYANWDQVSDRFLAANEAGRVLVVYDSKFEVQANKYSALVQKRMGREPVLFQAGSSSDIRSKIKSLYSEQESLSYVTIIGRDVPTLRGSQTGGKECDHCYVMMSGGVSLDIFIGRLSGNSESDIETQLSKIAAYDEHSTAAWTRQAYGTAFNLAGDEYQTMTDIMSNLAGDGFTKHDWVHGSSARGEELYEQMNQGLGVFSYLGHGQGDAWDTPMMTESDIRRLTNQQMPFFEIDVSCDNGGFQTYSPCMGEALLTATGGAIASMMHAPEARGTMCKHYMVQASLALKEGKMTRVGSVYTAALMAAQAADPDDYAVQGYNVFGDPTLQLPFAGSSRILV